MSKLKLVGFTGSFNRPSRSRALIQAVADAAASRYGLAVKIYDINDLGDSLGSARKLEDLDPGARAIVQEIIDADVLVVGSPTYKGSYTGLFKHAFDLLPPTALIGKPVVLTATGGGDRHALVVEHQLRPLFGFFQAQALATAIYASDRELADYRLSSEAAEARISQAVAELAHFVETRPRQTILAAE